MVPMFLFTTAQLALRDTKACRRAIRWSSKSPRARKVRRQPTLARLNNAALSRDGSVAVFSLSRFRGIIPSYGPARDRHQRLVRGSCPSGIRALLRCHVYSHRRGALRQQSGCAFSAWVCPSLEHSFLRPIDLIVALALFTSVYKMACRLVCSSRCATVFTLISFRNIVRVHSSLRCSSSVS